MNYFSKIFLCLLLIQYVYADEFSYEFGTDVGDVLYQKEGQIPILVYQTIVDIPVPENMMVTHILVVVDSLSSPKVDYDPLYKKVSIKYTWTQITLSSYKVTVKAIKKA